MALTKRSAVLVNLTFLQVGKAVMKIYQVKGQFVYKYFYKD